MSEFWFYHLEHSSMESILPDILEKTHAKDWRALVLFGSLSGREALAHFDKYLWVYKQNSFLPHGVYNEPLADKQPILLASDSFGDGFDYAVSDRDVLLLLGGAELNENISHKSFVRIITIFSDNNNAEKKRARKRWKWASDNGFETCYWKQDERGRWARA